MGELIVVPAFKKGSHSDCANLKEISLSLIPPKLLASFTVRTLYTMRERQTREEQAGFSTVPEGVDQLFILRQLL